MSNDVEHFMPLWIADYLADTTRLSTAQHGAYLLLLMSYWREGQPLPDDDEELAIICRAPIKEWKRDLRPKIERFFRIEDGKWHQKRADEELEKARTRLDAQRLRTQAATDARKKRNGPQENNVTTNVTSHQNPNVTSTTSQLTTHIEDNPPPPITRSADGISDFDRFWDAYPTSPAMSRDKAEAAWRNIRDPRPEIEAMLACVAGYRAHLEADAKTRKPSDPVRVAHAATWLNDRRWSGFLAAAEAERAKAQHAHETRMAKIPDGVWRRAAALFAEAHGWQAWDNAVLDCTLTEGDTPTIEYPTAWARNHANERGTFAALRRLIGGELLATVRGKVAA